MAIMPVAAIGLLLVGTGVASAQTMPTTPISGGGSTGAWHGRGGFGMMGRGTFGTVTAISGTTLTVASKTGPSGTAGTVYTVNAANATVTKSGGASSVSNIAVGDTVMVAGTVSGTSITATSIRDGVMGGGRMVGGKASGVVGAVASVSGNTLTVTSKMGSNGAAATTYTVDATNATVTKSGAASSVSNIAVGDTVMVAGTVSGTTVTATSIRDGVMGASGAKTPAQSPIQGNGEPVVGGAITAINGTSLTVTNKSNVTYAVDASTATIVKGNVTSSISNVNVGDNVIVQGTVNGTSVAASSVIDQGAAATNAGNTPSQGHSGFVGGIFSAIGGFFGHLFGF